MARLRRVVSDRDEALGTEQQNQGCEQIFAHRSLAGIMGSIGEGIVGLMGMQRKDVPKKYGNVDFIQHGPDNCGCPLRNG